MAAPAQVSITWCNNSVFHNTLTFPVHGSSGVESKLPVAAERKKKNEKEKKAERKKKERKMKFTCQQLYSIIGEMYKMGLGIRKQLLLVSAACEKHKYIQENKHIRYKHGLAKTRKLEKFKMHEA